jgi:hypothetical protein
MIARAHGKSNNPVTTIAYIVSSSLDSLPCSACLPLYLIKRRRDQNLTPPLVSTLPGSNKCLPLLGVLRSGASLMTFESLFHLPTLIEDEMNKKLEGLEKLDGAIASATAQSARVAEEAAYEAQREAILTGSRISDAEVEVEDTQRMLAEATEASRRGYALAPDTSEARRDQVRKLTASERARKLAEAARIRADDRLRNPEMTRNFGLSGLTC